MDPFVCSIRKPGHQELFCFIDVLKVPPLKTILLDVFYIQAFLGTPFTFMVPIYPKSTCASSLGSEWRTM